MARLRALAVLTVVALLALPTGAGAQKRGPRTDLIWTHPEFARLGIQSIALLPVATYDHNATAERTVAAAWGQQYHASGHRWMSPQSSAVLMRVAGGDSLVKSVEKTILSAGRIDSLRAPMLCARMHVQALLTLRVDRWEQTTVEPDQRGKPSTTVRLTAALVDSVGRLVWRGSGAETTEGIEHIPMANPAGGRTTEAQLGGLSTSAGPPAYTEVLARLLTRWGDGFPARTAAAPAAATADSARAR